MTGEVQAATAWPSNAELIADVARLGHLRRVVSMCGHLGHDPDMLGRCRDCGAVDCQGAAT